MEKFLDLFRTNLLVEFSKNTPLKEHLLPISKSYHFVCTGDRIISHFLDKIEYFVDSSTQLPQYYGGLVESNNNKNNNNNNKNNNINNINNKNNIINNINNINNNKNNKNNKNNNNINNINNNNNNINNNINSSSGSIVPYKFSLKNSFVNFYNSLRNIFINKSSSIKFSVEDEIIPRLLSVENYTEDGKKDLEVFRNSNNSIIKDIRNIEYLGDGEFLMEVETSSILMIKIKVIKEKDKIKIEKLEFSKIWSRI
ncbi:hypothetical protein NGRA_3158 [Nosema granulosis]|uniref:Uncharacterized protein n=1 Tax=Nosema granulosis TaxID=83296 RepID=A0A9P6GWC8_9MICR|nr:hypothetical protein NGRA_3158 [Nosema granulosis]